jgi:DNA-binding beta-propeller fold protein YncE
MKRNSPEPKTMKTNLLCKISSIIHAVIFSRPSSSRLRIAAAGTLVLAGAALAATLMQPPKLPWAVPTVTVGNAPGGVAVDPVTDTIYVANVDDGTISVIDGRRCNARNASHCAPIATMTNAGLVPPNFWITFDQTSGTLYVTNGLTATGDDGNTITVLNGRTCNARNTSGCGQTPAATVTVPGVFFSQETEAFSLLALDASNHTLYAGDANDGPVSMVNTATCNAMNTSGCSQVPSTMANGDATAIDYSNHSVYVTNFNDNTVSVFNGTTCNATTQSDCTQFSVAPLPAGFFPAGGNVEETTHTLYVPLAADTGILGYTAVIDGSTCNGTNQSGCGNTPHLVQVGSGPFLGVVDPTTKTVYIMSENSSKISVINAATCNGTNQSGCPQRAPALAVGVNPVVNVDINPNTHTLYTASLDTNTVWVLDASKCNGIHTSGCTKFEPTTTTGAGAQAFANNPDTHTLYVSNQLENTVSIIDSSVCNQGHLAGCNQTWPKFVVGNFPRFFGVNRITNTIYLATTDDNTLTVINGLTCNSTTTSGCTSLATTAVGNVPQQIAVDEITNTIYVVNQGDGTASVINGAVCNGTDTSGCGQAWPTVTVGQSPQALAFNPNDHTVYVANTNDNTVSVINTLHCNATDSSGCGQTPATIPVGAKPRSVGIVFATNTVFVGNRNDLTVSVIDGSTCNGTNTSGCGSMPPAVLVGAFPSTAGNGNNLLGRNIAVDSMKHIIYIPNIGDSDIATLDANDCRAGHVNGCHVKIVHERMGGFPVVATVDEGSETVYVANNDDGTVSVLPSSR